MIPQRGERGRWVAVAAGSVERWAARGGSFLASFGGFNLFGGVDHSLLRLHQIRSGVGDLLPDDGLDRVVGAGFSRERWVGAVG